MMNARKNNYFFNTKIIAKKQIYFTEIESTQNEAKKLAERNIENGTIIITDYQTKGKGTHDRKWYSEKNKNLSFTIILYPKCQIDKLENLTVDIAKCITKVIKNLFNIELEIKFPNDIMLKMKKMGGILTQMVTEGEKIRYLLIGIGINVNGENFNEEIKDIATSLKKEFKKSFSKENILNNFCMEFEKYCIEKNII